MSITFRDYMYVVDYHGVYGRIAFHSNNIHPKREVYWKVYVYATGARARATFGNRVGLCSVSLENVLIADSG